jgi:hypothetical protein
MCTFYHANLDPTLMLAPWRPSILSELCGFSANGSRAQTHLGHIIDTQVDCGTLMSSRLIWPAVTASRCSAIRSMCSIVGQSERAPKP